MEWTKEEVAWFAGLFEGEGSLSRNRPNPNSSWRMSLKMADRDIISRIKEIFGGKMYDEPHHHINPNHKDLFLWQLSTQKEISDIVIAIYPFMGKRRQAKMDEFLEHYAKPTSTSRSENAKTRWQNPGYREKQRIARSQKASATVS